MSCNFQPCVFNGRMFACADPTSGYKNLGDLASRLQSTFYIGAAKDAAAPPAEATSTATQAGSEASPLSTSMSAAAARSVQEDPTSQLKGARSRHTLLRLSAATSCHFKAASKGSDGCIYAGRSKAWRCTAVYEISNMHHMAAWW